jgi:hypothetical protein
MALVHVCRYTFVASGWLSGQRICVQEDWGNLLKRTVRHFSDLDQYR